MPVLPTFDNFNFMSLFYVNVNVFDVIACVPFLLAARADVHFSKLFNATQTTTVVAVYLKSTDILFLRRKYFSLHPI